VDERISASAAGSGIRPQALHWP